MMQRKKSPLEIILENYESDRANEWKDGRMDRLINRIVVEKTLASDSLSPRDRQVVALRYLCRLDQDECASILHVSQQAISQRVDRCLSAITHTILDVAEKRSQNVWRRDYIETQPDIDHWMVKVLHNQGQWWRVPDNVFSALQEKFGLKGDSVDRTDYDKLVSEPKIYMNRWWNGQDVSGRKRIEIINSELVENL